MDSQTPSPSSSSSSSSRTVDTINAYSPHFETELRRRRVFFLRGRADHNPIDVDEFKSFVSRERNSPEPTEEDVQRIRVKADRSRNEAAVVQSILPELLPVDDLYTNDDFETIPNQQWDKRVTLPIPAFSTSVADGNGSPSRKRKAPGSAPGTPTKRGTRLAVPKPDQAIGISSESLTCYNAREHLGHVCTPVAADSDLLFPFFTAECKGDQGRLKVSRMQNAHNAAVMLHNMRQLHYAASNNTFGVKGKSVDPFVESEKYDSTVDTEDMHSHVDKDMNNDARKNDSFHNHIHAVTLSLSTESIELCYHWASPSEHTAKRQKCASITIPNKADMNICSRPLNTWSLSSESHNDYVMARRCVRNALDWCRDRTAGWVRCKMRGLEDRLCRKRHHEGESQPVPQPKRQKRARTERSSSPSSDRIMFGSHEISKRRNALLETGIGTRMRTRLTPRLKPSVQDQSTHQCISLPTELKYSGSSLKMELTMGSSTDNDAAAATALTNRRHAPDNSDTLASRRGLMTSSKRIYFPGMITDDNNNKNSHDHDIDIDDDTSAITTLGDNRNNKNNTTARAHEDENEDESEASHAYNIHNHSAWQRQQHSHHNHLHESRLVHKKDGGNTFPPGLSSTMLSQPLLSSASASASSASSSSSLSLLSTSSSSHSNKSLTSRTSRTSFSSSMTNPKTPPSSSSPMISGTASGTGKR